MRCALPGPPSRAACGLLLLLLWALPGAGGCLEFHSGPTRYPGKPFAYVDVDGVQIHYRELGPPPPAAPAASVTAPAAAGAPAAAEPETIVFLHGFGGALVSWLYCQPQLATRYRTVSLDLKGFGLSDKPPGDYSIEAEAELVREVMDRLQIRRAHLVAHSWGSSVALALALRHPERVGKLVLVSGFVYEEQLNSFMRWSKLPVLGELLFGAFYDEQLEARYTWGFYEPERMVKPEHFDYLRQFQAVPGLKAASLATVRGMDLAALEPRYRQVAQPALLIWGQADRVSPVRFGQRLATDLPQARLVTLAHAGHNSMLERAGTFTTLVMEFLGT